MTSWSGKVVGGVARMGRSAARPVLVVAGEVARADMADIEGAAQLDVVSLSEGFGTQRARAEPATLIARSVEEYLVTSYEP